MKIVKLIKNEKYNHYYVMFDYVPEITYEKVGLDYIGTAVDSKGRVIASNVLGYESFKGAFAGRELEIEMKDGTKEKIKDHWYDKGSSKNHGEFIGIGAGTLESLQRCYVYFSYNINKELFEKMVEEYLTRDRLYEYYEVEDWAELQYDWYDVIVHGEKIPFMMNKYGDIIDKTTKKRVYGVCNKGKKVKGEWRTYTYFKLQYKDGKRLRKIEANYLETLKSTLPFSEEEIKSMLKKK